MFAVCLVVERNIITNLLQVRYLGGGATQHTTRHDTTQQRPGGQACNTGRGYHVAYLSPNWGGGKRYLQIPAQTPGSHPVSPGSNGVQDASRSAQSCGNLQLQPAELVLADGANQATGWTGPCSTCSVCCSRNLGWQSECRVGGLSTLDVPKAWPEGASSEQCSAMLQSRYMQPIPVDHLTIFCQSSTGCGRASPWADALNMNAKNNMLI